MNKTAIAFYLLLCFSCSAQTKISLPDLSKKGNFTTINREVSLSTDKTGNTTIHMNANKDAGIAWINDFDFSTGIIEFDAKGKDVLQKSFIGIAFSGINDSTYQGVYFRPFNFQSSDINRKAHSVQYISLPKHDWEFLRESYPGRYENKLTSPQNPNDWFHVRINITENNIQVFINANTQPCLNVQPITPVASGKSVFG